MLQKFLLVFTILLLNLHSGYTQEIPRVGTPYVQQYTKFQYQGGNQNWNIAISQEGFIYAANTEGLLCFDGHEWKLYSVKNGTSLRSAYIDSKGRILVGGEGEFGYWTRGSLGEMKYSSLSDLVKDKQSLKQDEIWRIIEHEDKLYFHSFSKNYCYDGKSITEIKADGEPFLFSFKVRNKLYFEQIPSGLHEFRNNQLIPLHEANKLKDMNILSMLAFDKEETLIATANHGLFILNKAGEIRAWENEAQDLLKKHQINNGISLFSDQYAFGTIQNGVYILNKAGEIVQHINKSNGLQNNTVLSLALDKQSNLWVGLDNGIDRIDINSSLFYYTDLGGGLGTVYTSVLFNNQIYLGTNQGLFVSDWKGTNQYESLQFRIIPQSQGQVWQLTVMNKQLVCGHNNGTFLVQNNQLKRISSFTGAWKFQPINQSPFWLQGNYTGVGLMRESPEITFVKQFSQKQATPIRDIIQRSPHEFWLSNKQHIYNLKLSNDFQESSEFSIYQKGLPEHIRINGLFNLANNIVFASDSGFYVYDNILWEFKPYKELNKQLGSFYNAHKVIPIQDNEYWFIKPSHLAHVKFSPTGTIQIDSTSWNSLKGRMMNEYEYLFPINDQLTLIGLDNGFALYFKQNAIKDSIPAPYVTQVWNITDGIKPIYENLNVPYSKNNIRISFASPWYESTAIKYQYKLLGYKDTWSDWDQVGYQDFTNLPHGDYVFQVKSMSANGIQSEIRALKIHINAPWYWSWWSILLYMLLIGILFYQFNKNYQSRLLRHQSKLEAQLLIDQEKRLAREAEETERKLMAIRNQQLEQELQNKNRELSNSAMNIVYKNEMLNNLHQELLNLKDAQGNQLNLEQLRKVNKLIDEAHNDDRDWDIFEKSFNESHENFFKKLKQAYPELVPNDLKLCAYLRLNMSSKEIASLLNISTRGVEIRRYRLRKKLNLPTQKNLTEFLLEL
ncbi:triple tyrosine motif-containing protein [Sphingobacterium sp. HJSM2_6]|uniref:triple tyrosine motif-containing protein n=1 Tax=Sphingobacterium sp. HJSM2_6 TaxID=3366264 RepID=UPI003BCDA644